MASRFRVLEHAVTANIADIERATDATSTDSVMARHALPPTEACSRSLLTPTVVPKAASAVSVLSSAIVTWTGVRVSLFECVGELAGVELIRFSISCERGLKVLV